MTDDRNALIERARAVYLEYMRGIARSKGDTLAEGQAEKCLAGEMDSQHGVQIALLALTPAGEPYENPDWQREQAMSQEPSAYLHTLHMEGGQSNRRLTFSDENAFGVPGRDYSEEYKVTIEPLHLLATPPREGVAAINDGAIREQAKRLWLAICELPDRTSPEDDPEACVMSYDEFESVLLIDYQDQHEATPAPATAAGEPHCHACEIVPDPNCWCLKQGEVTQRHREAAEAFNASLKGRVLISDRKMVVEEMAEAFASFEAPLATALRTLQAEVKRLQELVYVPGIMRCAKCSFVVMKSVLNANTGTVSSSPTKPESCPNDGSPLWRVSERTAGNEAIDRATAAEAREKVLREALESVRDYVQDTGRAGWYDEGGSDAALAEIDAALMPAEVTDRPECEYRNVDAAAITVIKEMKDAWGFHAREMQGLPEAETLRARVTAANLIMQRLAALAQGG